MFKQNISIMKKIKTLLILGALLLVGFASQSQSITYRFNNFMVVPGAVDDTLIFDVEAKSNVGTTYTTQFGMFIKFSTTAFGANALPVSVQQLVLTTPTGYNYNFPAQNAGANRFASSFQAFIFLPPFSLTYNTAFLSNLTTEFQGVARYKMLITGTGLLGVEFDATAMANQSSYVLSSGGTVATFYTPTTAFNTLVNMPPDLTNYDLMFSELGDPSDAGISFVEIYNAGAVSVNLGVYPWFLSIDGSSSSQLTGTIAAGGTIVVDITGTPGTSEFLLSLYGDYTNGVAIDAYDGSLAGFDFTNKHAVRHYNIISPNLTPTLSEWVLSSAKNVDMTDGSHRATLTWLGGTTDWHTQSNWTGNNLPDAGHNVSILNAGETTPVIGINDNAYTHDLTILGSDVGLIVKSHPTNGDGSLITYGTVTGITSVERFLASDRYWYVSQPVTSAVANVFLHIWMFTYDELSGVWGDFIVPETTPLNVMEGYAVWTSSINPWYIGHTPMGDTTTAYEGLVNTGDISKALTYSSVGSIYGDGWNFVGNPYPSAVDWEAAGWTKTSLVTNSFSVWNGVNYGTYTVGSGGTNGATKYIPAAQGFFVQVNAAGSLGVSNAVRTHSTQDFWKSEDNMFNRLSLTVSNGDVNDETVIYFNDEATTELDYLYDGKKLMATAVPQLYTMLASDRMAINTFNNTTQTTSVIMGVSAPEAGELTITASNIESFDASTPIYLEDLLTGQKINLREMSSYTFSAGEGISERFVVHFAEYQGLGDNTVSDITNIYATDLNVYVDFSAENGEIAIYNILGQEISRSDAFNGLNMVSVPQGNAVYIVKVISDNTTVTKKVFVK